MKLQMTLALCLGLAIAFAGHADAAQVKPTIRIIRVPPRGSGPDRMEPIAGVVTGAPSNAIVVVYAVAGGQLWVQPFTNSFATAITNGQWSTSTHLGDEYVAFLVGSSWAAPAKMNSEPAVGGAVLAKIRVRAQEPGTAQTSRSGPNKSAIQITNVPFKGRGGDGPMAMIEGTTSEASDDNVVVVYCYAGGRWWVQPYADNYLTTIHDGRWSTRTRPGEAYMAILTTRAWLAPSTLTTEPTVGGVILSLAKAEGR